MQQEDKLKYVFLYVTNVPEGSMDLLSIEISKQHGKYLVKFYSHRTEPKIGAATSVSKHTPNDWSLSHLHVPTRDSLRHKFPTIALSSKVLDHINLLMQL